MVVNATLDELRVQSGHVVSIRWKNELAASQIEPPTCLDIQERDRLTWTGILQGPVHDLVRWLSFQPMDDLTITRPDLEMLFRRYYERRGQA